MNEFLGSGHPDLNPDLLSQDMSHWVDVRYLSQYGIYEDRIHIRDEVWGDVTIGDQPGDEVFLDLVQHPVIRRLHSIAQLTLPASMETMPGIYTTDLSDGFTRWHHAFGSLAFVRLKGTELGLDPMLLRHLELTTFLSDATQWAGSHLGDFMFQGFGGPEDDHDSSQQEVLTKAGLGEVLNAHGYEISDVLLSNLPEEYRWIESPSPDLCTDRVDYGVRQISRHLDLSPSVHSALHPEAFVVDPQSNELVMKNKELALAFGKAFLLLAPEHWQEPIHRLQLFFLQEMVKHLLIHEEPMLFGPLTELTAYHPRDYMLTVDADLFSNFGRALPFIWNTKDVTEDIARQKRLIYSQVRKEDLDRFINNPHATQLPDPFLNGDGWRSSTHSLWPSHVEIIATEEPKEIPQFKTHPNAVDIVLKGLKRRWVDPKYIDSDGNIKRLSEQDENYAKLMKHQEELLERTYVARVLVNTACRSYIQDGLDFNDRHWPEVMQRPRMPDDLFKQSFEFAANSGVPHRKARIIWGL